MKKKAIPPISNSITTPHWGSAQHLFSFLEGGLLELTDLNEFLCQGGNIHCRNEKGETLIHVACRVMDVQALLMLLAAGGRARVVDKDRQTPLHWAVAWNQSLLIDPLLKAGAKVDAQNKEGVTPLMKLIQDKGWHENSESKKHRLQTNLDKLLSYASNLNLADEQGWTALHYAGYYGHLLPVSKLLKKGASPVLWDTASQIPKDLIQKNHPQLWDAWLSLEEQYRLSLLPNAIGSNVSQRL